MGSFWHISLAKALTHEAHPSQLVLNSRFNVHNSLDHNRWMTDDLLSWVKGSVSSNDPRESSYPS